MTLTTHGIVGASVVVASATNPILGLVGAFGSHFILDALPHLDYRILSLDKEIHKQSNIVKIRWNKLVLVDFTRIGVDFTLGILGALVIFNLFSFNVPLWLVLLGAFLGMLPDLLQFVYGQLGGKVLGWIQTFHNFAHTKHKLEEKFLVGVTSQLSVIGLTFWLLNLYK